MIWQFLANAALTLGLFLVGLYMWRRQLVAKRRFEVSEQAIAATIGAIEGLSHIRQGTLWAAELAAVEVPKEMMEEDETRMRDREVYFARARLTEAAFRELRVAQVLADIHINSETYEAMDEIFKARQEVIAAVIALHDKQMDEEGLAPERRTQVREIKLGLSRTIAEGGRDPDGKPEPTDTISIRLDAAKATIEAACRPFLRG